MPDFFSTVGGQRFVQILEMNSNKQTHALEKIAKALVPKADLPEALAELLAAAELVVEPLIPGPESAQGACTPTNPHGQSTAVRVNGELVNGFQFKAEATRRLQAAIDTIHIMEGGILNIAKALDKVRK
jgi:hypothetical protein